MPSKRLTDMFVARVTPPRKGRVEYFDAAFAGLALRVTDRGRKSWSLHFRIGGHLRRLTLGTYPALTPAQARQEANLALEKVRRGIDPCVAHALQVPPAFFFEGALLSGAMRRSPSRRARPTTCMSSWQRVMAWR